MFDKKEYMLLWRQNNKHRIKEYKKKHRKIHKKAIALYKKEYRKRNREMLCAYQRKYNKTPNGRLVSKASDHRRRMRTADLKIHTIQQIYEDNIKQYGTLTCYLCLKPIPFGKDHLEHKTPLIRGGTNNYDNLAVACQKCNHKKFTKTEEEYRNYLMN